MPDGWDHAAAVNRLDGDESLLCELIAIFFEEYPNLLGRLHRGMAERDLTAVREIAHSLKGSLSYLGANAVAARARELETAAGENDFVRAAELVHKLTLDVDALRQIMTVPGASA
jgi:two-component system sensor histidine kinase/response regulator